MSLSSRQNSILNWVQQVDALSIEELVERVAKALAQHNNTKSIY